MKKQFILKIIGIGVFVLAISCAARNTPPAPVINASQIPAYAQPEPAAVPPTQSLAVTKPKLEAVDNDDEVQTTPVKKSQSTNRTVVVKQPDSDNDSTSSSASNWQMPTNGTMGSYSASSKGVNIPGTEGQAIYAVAPGKVLYSGNGLKGYGNLIIIRHDNTYLSAYAYNKANLVKEGATVQQGQKIATMGVNDSNQPMLHLEVRKNGKPVDPHTMIGN